MRDNDLHLSAKTLKPVRQWWSCGNAMFCRENLLPYLIPKHHCRPTPSNRWQSLWITIQTLFWTAVETVIVYRIQPFFFCRFKPNRGWWAEMMNLVQSMSLKHFKWFISRLVGFFEGWTWLSVRRNHSEAPPVSRYTCFVPPFLPGGMNRMKEALLRLQ